MCRLYTKAFIRCGMMGEGGRAAYNEVHLHSFSQLDPGRARNEIALVNTNTGQVTYGLDSLLHIIGNSFPLLEKAGRFPPLYFLFRKLYAFISYNRKQIIPKREMPGTVACTPDFNRTYRIAYILFTAIISSIVLSRYSIKLGTYLPQQGHLLRELLVCFGQIAWQSIWLTSALGKAYWDYIGNMMSVSLIGSLLLFPMLMFSVSPALALVYFMIVVSMMLAEHYRRCTILNIGIRPSISWVLYRVLVLIIIFLIG